MMPIAVLAGVRLFGVSDWPKRHQYGALAAVLVFVIAYQWSPPTAGYRYPVSKSGLFAWRLARGVQSKFLPQAVAAISASGYSGNLYAPYGISGYASYVLHPDVRLFVNGRYDSYSAAVYHDHQEILAGGSSAATIIDRYTVDGVLLPLTGSFYKLGFSLKLLGWCEAFHGDRAMWLLSPTVDKKAGAQCKRATIENHPMVTAPSIKDLSGAIRHHRLADARAIAKRLPVSAMTPSIYLQLDSLCRMSGRLAGELDTQDPRVAGGPTETLEAATQFCDWVADNRHAVQQSSGKK